MTEREFRDLELDDIVYNKKTKVVRAISSALSDKEKEDLSEIRLWTNDLGPTNFTGCEGIAFAERGDWECFKSYDSFTDLPDWVKIEWLYHRQMKLESFIMQTFNVTL